MGVKDFPIDAELIPAIALGSFPRGDYRVDMNYYDKKDQVMVWSKIYFSINAKRYKKKSKSETL